MKHTEKYLIAAKSDSVIIRKCHICGDVKEASKELERCFRCQKSFLPSHYFSRIHEVSIREYSALFAHVDEIYEEDLVKGLNVIW